ESPASVGHRTVEFAEAAPCFDEPGVGGSEAGSRSAFGGGPRRAGVIARVEVGEIAGDPASETLPDQVPDPVQVSPGADGLLDVDGRIPGRLQGPFGLLE